MKVLLQIHFSLLTNGPVIVDMQVLNKINRKTLIMKHSIRAVGVIHKTLTMGFKLLYLPTYFFLQSLWEKKCRWLKTHQSFQILFQGL